MKIKIKLEASVDTGHHSVDLKDLGFTPKEWEALSEAEKLDAIKNEVDNLPDQPYWTVESYTEAMPSQAAKAEEEKKDSGDSTCMTFFT